MITKQSGEALMLYSWYQKGHLAVDGGVLNQPHKYLEMMKVIEKQVKSD